MNSSCCGSGAGVSHDEASQARPDSCTMSPAGEDLGGIAERRHDPIEPTLVPARAQHDDCCGPRTEPTDSDSCQGDCCGSDSVDGGSVHNAENEPNKGIRAAISACENVAGFGDTVERESLCHDECCDGKPDSDDVHESAEAFNKALDVCGAGARASADGPDCCRGNKSPCCDESCLERLALRECRLGGDSKCQQTSCARTRTSSEKAHGDGRACQRHQLTIREQYAAKIEALGCICRALLAMGKESCCESRNSTTLRGKRQVGKQVVRYESVSQTLADSCCATSTATPEKSCAKLRARPKRSAKDLKGSCAESCCEAKERSALEVGDLEPLNIGSDQNVSHAVEHVVLSISGMTCTGCETKLNRTLSTLPGLSNLKTSLVLSRAEFDVEVDLMTVDQVLKHLERRTEFSFTIIDTTGTSTIDIVYSGDKQAFMGQTWADGILDMSIIGESIRVSYDPAIVGARDLLEERWHGLATLAPVCHDAGLAAGSKHVRYLAYMTLLSAVLTIPVLVLAWAPLPEHKIAYGSASLALASVIQVLIVGPFYPKALKALVFSRVIEMDLLIVLSTSAAYIFSVVAYAYVVAQKPLATEQFFEASTLLVTLIMVGRYVAAMARQKAVESVSVRSLQAQNALLMESIEALHTRVIDARLLQYGDIFKVLPDCKVPTDGTVLSGSSDVDESMLTGESRPVEKAAGSPVIAGTMNGSGVLVVRLNRLPGTNTINTIAAMVDQAKLSKPKLQELADRVASYFVPVVVGLTIVTFVIWVLVGMYKQQKSGAEAAVQAITYAITVLIVSCPCAIGLAVPMVVVIASGVAAERGVIFKAAQAIEVSHKTSHVVFDKTGTLTLGSLAVTQESQTPGFENDSAQILLGLIGESKHPVASAVRKYLQDKGVTAKVISQTKMLTGRGIEGEYDGKVARAGNCRWLGLSDNSAVRTILEQGQTAFCFVVDNKLASIFGLADKVRPEAKHVVDNLRDQNIQVHILSGDDDEPVQRIASELGIATENTRSRSSPSDKQVYIEKLQGGAASEAQDVVIFCGDGTNDAVALAQATIGVHMNEGSEVAQTAADVVLMRPDLSGILTMLKVSKLSVRRIQFNFGWSFVYNMFAVLLAAGAFVNARIPPQFAGLGELVSVLPVIGAAVLLRWARI